MDGFNRGSRSVYYESYGKGASSMSTLYFPQLANGNIAQYPLTRTWLRAATINNLPDGSVIVLASVTPARMSWALTYSGLSQGEWSAIEALFEGVQGQFGNFTFVDPADNLLSWSEISRCQCGRRTHFSKSWRALPIRTAERTP